MTETPDRTSRSDAGSRTPEPDVARCLAMADVVLLCARMLESPTEWDTTERQVIAADISSLALASGIAAVPGGKDALETAVHAWSDGGVRTLGVEHARLFDGAVACPCNETVYVRRDKGVILADIAGFYRAFGFERAERFREKHDHVVVELQFVAVLLVLLGRAIENGTVDQREVTRKAIESFLRDHLGPWIEPFSERLRAVANGGFYGHVGELLGRGWLVLRQSFELDEIMAAGDVNEDQGSPYECGMCLDDAGEPTRVRDGT